MQTDKRITLAMTGASGAPYGLRLLELLTKAGYDIHLLISSAAKVVLATEENLKVPAKADNAAEFFAQHVGCDKEQISVYGKDEWFSCVASGSAAPRQMVICPCSTGTLSAIASGACDNLIERAADVVIKERGQLIMVTREMPLSSIHLENMLKLSNLGVTMMPASPGFYHNPTKIGDLVDFVVARILDHLGIEQSIMARWGYKPGQSPD
ncbi:flavin prenyltransferase UbiX [Aestuariibacter salexigens]|uniref:flavin prenyltransferase UbiX n=1 Tax=Aestuariibacter salexigens TaxID=226010 RepID=UPI00040C86F6|nr:flavin prenyltransferase UbiX [Aestuariibacter salexigens]